MMMNLRILMMTMMITFKFTLVKWMQLES